MRVRKRVSGSIFSLMCNKIHSKMIIYYLVVVMHGNNKVKKNTNK
jgi:hypothetical protein